MNEEIMRMFEMVTLKTEFNNYKAIQQASMKKLEDKICLLEKKMEQRKNKKAVTSDEAVISS